MSTTINKKINHIFILLEKLAKGQELYVQDVLLQEELFIANNELKDVKKANERSLRRYLEDIYYLYQHIIVTEKKVKNFSNKKVVIYRISNKKDVSSVVKFFLEEKNDLTWIIQILNNHNPFLLQELEEDAKRDFEKQLKKDENIFLFNSNPFEILDTDEQKEIFSNLKNAVKNYEYRDIEYNYNTDISYKNVKCLKMIYTQNNWYVGVETKEEFFKLLRISFITKIKYSKKNNYNKSVLVKYVDYFKKFENAMSLYNQKPMEAIFITSPSAAIYFEKKMKKFYKSQKFIKMHDDGSIEFSILYTQPIEILPFIKQWLPRIKLISPDSLKKILIKELKESIIDMS